MRRALLSVLLLLLAAAGLWWWSAGLPGAPFPLRPTPAERGVLRLFGYVDLREVRPAFDVSGRIDQMLLEEGDVVEPGRLIATPEDAVYRAQEAAARAALEAARARLAQLEAGARPQEIERARAELERLEALRADVERRVRRLRRLVVDRFAPRAELDSAESQLRALDAQIRAQQQTLELLIEGPRKEEIAAARAEVKRLGAELAIATKRLADTRLVAKARGVVTARLHEPGDVVLPHTPVYTIALGTPVFARVWIEEPWLGRVRVGMPAVIRTDSGGRYAARVGYVSPVAEFTPRTVHTEEVRTSLTYEVRVYADNPDGGLRQGMPVTVEIPLREGS